MIKKLLLVSFLVLASCNKDEEQCEQDKRDEVSRLLEQLDLVGDDQRRINFIRDKITEVQNRSCD